MGLCARTASTPSAPLELENLEAGLLQHRVQEIANIFVVLNNDCNTLCFHMLLFFCSARPFNNPIALPEILQAPPIIAAIDPDDQGLLLFSRFRAPNLDFAGYPHLISRRSTACAGHQYPPAARQFRFSCAVRGGDSQPVRRPLARSS